jgi:hypothetical protein
MAISSTKAGYLNNVINCVTSCDSAAPTDDGAEAGGRVASLVPKTPKAAGIRRPFLFWNARRTFCDAKRKLLPSSIHIRAHPARIFAIHLPAKQAVYLLVALVRRVGSQDGTRHEKNSCTLAYHIQE